MDQNIAGSAGTDQFTIHVWASCLYTSRSIDRLVYNQPAGIFPEQSLQLAVAGQH